MTFVLQYRGDKHIDITVISNLLDKKTNMDIPKRFYEYRDEAITFSKIIFKKMKTKLPLKEVVSLFNESKNLKIHTPEIAKLGDLVEAAENWISEAELVKNEICDLSKVNRLLSEASKINVSLDM